MFFKTLFFSTWTSYLEKTNNILSVAFLGALFFDYIKSHSNFNE